MIRTIEAVIDERGDVKLVEPVKLTTKHRALVTILEEPPAQGELRPYALAAGQFKVPPNFDAPLPDDILADFEGK